VQSRDAHGVRLDLPDLFTAEAPQPVQPVGEATALELIEPRQLLLLGGHDQLAAALVGDALLVAEPVDLAGALHAEARLERAGLVVEAGVDDPAVVPALVSGNAVLRLQDGDCDPALGQGHGRGHPHQSAADHDGVAADLRHGASRSIIQPPPASRR
jgi:hypothetical protein